MSLGLAFWIIWLILIAFGIGWQFGVVGIYGPIGGWAIFLLMLTLLGWKVFGPPLKG